MPAAASPAIVALRAARAFLRHPSGLVGLVILLAVVAVAILAPMLFPDSPWDMAGAPFQPPLSDDLPLGSDTLGRNIAAGIAHEAVVESALLERAVAIATARSGKGRDITATLKRDLYAPVLSTLA